MRRQICALLNKLAPANFDNISDEVVSWALKIERSDNPVVLNTLVYLIFQRGILDGQRIELYAKLCQKIVDELEGERSRWKTVDVYYVGNPFLSFEMAMQILVQREFDRVALQRSAKELRCVASFVGELLVHGVLSSEDVNNMLELLFTKTANNSEEHTGILCSLLGRIIRAADASQLIEALSVIERVERVLQEGMLSSKVRFMLMVSFTVVIRHIFLKCLSCWKNILDQALYPKPHDIFTSAQRRTEVYGLDEEDDEENGASLHSVKMPTKPAYSRKVTTIRQRCQQYADTFITSGILARGEAFFIEITPAYRHHLVAALLSAVLVSNDSASATLVAQLFSLASIRTLGRDMFAAGFESEIIMLEDTVLDIPSAYRLLAYMLHACGLDQNTVEDLASRIIVRENRAKDRFMEEYYSLADSLDPAPDISTATYYETSEFSDIGDRVPIHDSDTGILSDSNAYASGSELAYTYAY